MLFGVGGVLPIMEISSVCFFLAAVMELFLIIPYEKTTKSKRVLRTVKSDLIGKLAVYSIRKACLSSCLRNNYGIENDSVRYADHWDSGASNRCFRSNRPNAGTDLDRDTKAISRKGNRQCHSAYYVRTANRAINLWYAV